MHPQSRPVIRACLSAGLIAAFVVSCGGSSSAPVPAPPETSALELFDTVWQTFDQSYSFFVLKNIDWSAARTTYRSRLTATSTDQELFAVLSAMLLDLEDAHVRLTTPIGTTRYTGWYDAYPDNFSAAVVSASYLGASERLSPRAELIYGYAADDVGYVRVASLSGSGFAADLRDIVAELGPIAGLVVDLRHNGGGDDRNGEAFVEVLARAEAVYRRVRFRDGPNHGDFGPFLDSRLTPAGPPAFSGPIAVLTNRRTASSAESMVLAFRTLSNAVTVGDLTAGASANPSVNRLPNGWEYTVSRWIEYLPDNTTFEGIGLVPDIRVDITPEDEAALRDTILDSALQSIRDRR